MLGIGLLEQAMRGAPRPPVHVSNLRPARSAPKRCAPIQGTPRLDPGHRRPATRTFNLRAVSSNTLYVVYDLSCAPAGGMQVEVWVMVAEPLGLILDSKEFLAPILTPFEAHLAFSRAPWPQHYSLEYDFLLQVTTLPCPRQGLHIALTS
jgi:hypothetical protein